MRVKAVDPVPACPASRSLLPGVSVHAIAEERGAATIQLETAPALPRERRAPHQDDELVAALRRSDADAAEHLVAGYGGRAYRLAFRILGNAEDAEEVVQDALWSAVHRIETFRGDAAFGSWLYRIVANAALGRVRARRAHTDVALSPELIDDRDDPARRSEARAVLAALDDVPPSYRSALLLRGVYGWDVAEIAAALRVTVPNAKSRVHRGRRFLRRRAS